MLKHSAMAKQIGWNKGSFSHWLNGRREIPKEKAEKLEKILVQYGYKP